MKEYAVIVGIPGPTLYKYYPDNKSKRQSMGNDVRPNSSLLTDGDINFMGNVLAWSDHGNNGMSLQEAIDAIQEVNPTLDRKKAKDLLERHILPKSYTDVDVCKPTCGGI